MDTYITRLSDLKGNEQLIYLKEISHALKSSAASFGADRLCDLAIAIDRKAKSNQLAEQGEDATEMLALLDITRDAYRSWTN